jgi:glycosyltransferase involved in cell wall biosynthesis
MNPAAQSINPTGKTRYAVVTPYYKEPEWMLRRCIDSVRNQTIAAEHILVADGFPQDWVDAENVRHFKLDRAHGDYGNAARGLGALLAVAEKYDGIAFLDADNWYDPDHIAACLSAAENFGGKVDFVAARRRFVRMDESVFVGMPFEFPLGGHIDTNCYFFFPYAFHILGRWCLLPSEMSSHGDALFHAMCRNEGLVPAVLDRATINYLCMFENVYRSHGEEPPADSKPPVDWRIVQSWLDTLTPEQFVTVQRLTGLHLHREEQAKAS